MIYEYSTIGNNKIIVEEKKSKFISESFFVSDKYEAKTVIDEVKCKSKDASHHVYAYSLLDGFSKSCDDREPPGTAGIQILNNINNFELKNTLIIITRYFGGIKLGMGGLSRTYFNCAKSLIETSEIIVKKLCYEITISLTYKEYDIIVKRNNFQIINVEFTSFVQVTFAIEYERLDEFKLLLNNKNLEISELKYV